MADAQSATLEFSYAPPLLLVYHGPTQVVVALHYLEVFNFKVDCYHCLCIKMSNSYALGGLRVVPVPVAELV